MCPPANTRYSNHYPTPNGHLTDSDDEEELGAWLAMADGGRGDDGNGDGDDLSMIAAGALSR